MSGTFSPSKNSIYNRATILRSDTCGCFYCLATFPPSAIKRWTDEGDTAICPHCGIDSVIGSATSPPLTPEFLKRLQCHSFGAPKTASSTGSRQKRTRKRPRR